MPDGVEPPNEENVGGMLRCDPVTCPRLVANRGVVVPAAGLDLSIGCHECAFALTSPFSSNRS